jgi:hypothetical protein
VRRRIRYGLRGIHDRRVEDEFQVVLIPFLTSRHPIAQGESNMNYLKRLADEVTSWPNVSVHSHRFGGQEFRFGKAEIGHVHSNGTVDIPFPRAIRDALLEEGQAEQHRWIPDSGWTTFKVRSGADVGHAVDLLRVSYLRYAVKTASDPRDFLKHESEALRLNSLFIALLEKVRGGV